MCKICDYNTESQENSAFEPKLTSKSSIQKLIFNEKHSEKMYDQQCDQDTVI